MRLVTAAPTVGNVIEPSGAHLGFMLDDVQTAVEIATGTVTALAVIVGGVWAYFRFVKERPYRPRLEVTMSGRWVDGVHCELFLARVAVRNIGTTVVRLLPKGTGLRMSTIATVPSANEAVSWKRLATLAIFREHDWIEPGETISDDLAVRLDVGREAPLLLECRLVWRWTGGDGNVVVFARQIISASGEPGGSYPMHDHEPHSPGGDR
jgi:hypothetical protein